MQAAKWFDPVLGIDVHMVIVPPSPAPVPLPHPFIGVVWDPIGLAIGAAMGVVFGGGGLVLINFVPAGNTGTNIKAVPHFPMPPGVSFHACDMPPGNDGAILTGSKTVTMMGNSEGRLGSLVMSCNYPINLPTSVCLAVPAGAPVIVGGPEAVDWMAAITQGIRTKWVSGKLHSLFKAKPGSRLSKVICFLTGHPVDVMTGAVLTDALDFELPGPLPLRFERHYHSRDEYAGALGQGWAHTLEAAVHDAGDELVVQLLDGRRIPHPHLARGQSRFDPAERHTLTRTADHAYALALADGRTLDFAAVPGSPVTCPLVQIRDRNANTISLSHDAGRLVAVTDSAGRQLRLRNDPAGRLTAVRLRRPGDRWTDLVRYSFDDHGQLAASIDPADHPTTYAYRGGVLVRETDRNGLSFHFEYDWDHPDGWCIRTWGDDNLYARTLTYDRHRHVTLVDDSRGGRTHYFGNPAGLVERILDPEGGDWRYEWHPELLQKTAVTDPLGHRSTWDHDARGNVVGITDPLGHQTRWHYDEHDNPITMTDARGHTWRRDHDARGNLVRTVDPLGATHEFRLDRHGRPLELRDPLGRTTRLTLDPAAQLVAATDPAGHTTRWTYDDRGNLVHRVDPTGAETRLQWDACGRLAAVETPDGARVTLEHDPEGNLVRRTDAHGRRWTYTYTGRGKLRSQHDPLGGRVTLAYDSEENLVAVTNELGETTSFEYDRRNHLVRETALDGRVLRHCRDAAGQLVAVIDGRDRMTRITRDPLGRITDQVDGDGAWQRYAYDPLGALIEATNEHAEVHLEVDPCGRLVRETAGDHIALSTHDLLGNLVHRTTALGAAIDYDRDEHGDLRRIRIDTREIHITRDEHGRELTRRCPGAIESHWERDPSGRPLVRRLLRDRTLLARTAYDWLPEDRLAAKHDDWRGTTRYTHDASGALVSAEHPDGTLEHRVPDLAGNLHRTPARTDRKYGPGGRLLAADGATFHHDHAGHLIERTGPDPWRAAYRAGQLREFKLPDGRLVVHRHDALGRRIRTDVRDPNTGATHTTRWLWSGAHLIHETSADHPPVTWHWEPDTFNVAAREQDGRLWTVLTDHLGAPAWLADESGAIACSLDLDLWGAARITGDDTLCPWRWPGQHHDPVTGLHYNLQRDYDPALGLYRSPDPLGVLGTLAPYAYVRDPLTQIDPWALTVTTPPTLPASTIAQTSDRYRIVHNYNDMSLEHANPIHFHVERGGNTVAKIRADGTVIEGTLPRSVRELLEEKPLINCLRRIEGKITRYIRFFDIRPGSQPFEPGSRGPPSGCK